MDKKVHLYIGTYTMPIQFGTGQILEGKGKGIYHTFFDENTGFFSTPELWAETDNPSFLASSEDGCTVYAVNELKQYMGKESGSISAFQVESSSLRFLNALSTGGTDPCYVITKRNCAYVANFMSGSVAAYRLASDGSFQKCISFHQHVGRGLRDDRQAGPHAHAVVMTLDGTLAYVPDLGLDKVIAYRIDDEGALFPETSRDLTLRSGAGPRLGTFSKDGRFFYLINELQCSITVFSCGENHEMKEIQTISSLPEDIEPEENMICAHLALTPDGRYLYSSNRGHDSITAYYVAQDGKLHFRENQSCGGKTPRHFSITPTGRFLLCSNQDTDNVVCFELQENGSLRKHSETGVPTPVCVLSMDE